jgi:anti-sigma-K factor RskA
MMDERHEELAALNALGMLENDEKRALDGVVARDKELRALSADFESVTAELGLLVTPVEPPPDLKRRIRAQVRARGGARQLLSGPMLLGVMGWAAAVALAAVSLWLWNERSKLARQLDDASRAIASFVPLVDDGKARTLEEELKKMRGDHESKEAGLKAEIATLKKRESESESRIKELLAEVEQLKQQNATVQMQVAILKSDVWEYRRSEALVVWDSGRHQGLVMLNKMPKVEDGQDYQLWVFDPQKTDPVSAGVVQVDEKGSAKIQFKPVGSVTDAAKFAVSVEKKGGVDKSTGQIVLVGP